MKEIATKILAENISVVGVTNYFIVEEKEISELRAELGASVYLIPNFEFRINEKNKDGEYINVHVLFNPETTTISRIQESLARIELTNIAGDTKKYCTLENVKTIGSDKITVSLIELCDQLNKDFKAVEDFLIVGVNKGYGGFCPGNKPRDQALALKIDNLSHFIFSKKEDVGFFLNKVEGRKKLSLIPKAIVECSDAHTVSEIGNKFSWIKAEPTFEGLKQIIYEPSHRIIISDNKPREPIRKIESINFNFPTGTYIKRNNSDDKQDFCLNHLKNKIPFSPYLTCLIGGRGTGKSTIINLLGERLGEKTDFFKENNLITDGNKYDIETDVNNLVAVLGTNEIEFVSQGKIESLAEGNELTKLIFNERIKEAESGFYNLDSEINSLILIIDESIKLLFDLQKTNLSLKEKNKEKGTTQNIIDSVNDDRYKEITNRINDIRKEINSIDNSQIRYENLLNSIRILLIENIQIETQNDIESRINEILDILKSIDEVVIHENEVSTKLKGFEASKERMNLLTREFVAENQKMKDFFQEKGMSEETIKDSQKANENLARINSEIIQLTAKVDRSNEIFHENSEKIDRLTGLYDSYYQLIDTNLTQINRKLEVNNENVLDINFKFEFNFENLKQIVFEEFYNVFTNYHISGTSANQVKEVLFLIEPNTTLLDYDYKTFLEKLESEINLKRYKRANNYVKMVTDIFASDINYNVYKLILRKHLYNLSKFTKIKGYYGERELQNCSFGQRCTAVIVTLLMTGVKPLVIDEPEAHLDNRLVADYLVDLIKSKKLDRQIIFATHNSNFVINGDSELIHILDIPLNNIFTNMTSTSIENIDNREKLLKLEGGKDAFLTREQKYGINN